MNNQTLYICPMCFQTCESQKMCHEHLMICCEPGEWGDARRRPVMDSQGRLRSAAPRWFLEATGRMQAAGRYTPFHVR